MAILASESCDSRYVLIGILRQHTVQIAVTFEQQKWQYNMIIMNKNTKTIKVEIYLKYSLYVLQIIANIHGNSNILSQYFSKILAHRAIWSYL